MAYDVLHRAENEGRLEGKRGGRKRKISKRGDCIINSLRTLAQELKEECDLDVSHETVRQTILRHKYNLIVTRRSHCFLLLWSI